MTQPHLRVVARTGDLLEPRIYAQSTSGSIDSQRTTPSLSRSNEMTSRSPNCPPAESFLRMYPKEVLHRLAKARRSAGVMDLRYERSTSISPILPEGHNLSIPSEHLPCGNSRYADEMDVQDIRKKRLRQLVQEYGTQTALAEKIGCEQNYISRALRNGKGAKGIGEDFAARAERATGKPEGWMSRLEKPTADWPFEFDRRHWDNLPADKRQDLERAFMHMVLGAEVDASLKGRRRA